nr:polyadenylate-binding protein 1-B-like [Ipomoea trifida]
MRIMWWQRNAVLIKYGIGNVFVKNLPPFVTSIQLESIFSKYGIILSCKVTEENGKCKCFGFVQFETHYSAIYAISSLHGAVFEGKKLYVSIFKKKEVRMMDVFNEQKFTNVYVKKFGYNMTDELLREKFSRYGNINSAVIMRDEEGNSRGFGFVNFDSDKDARKAVEALNGQVIGDTHTCREWFVDMASRPLSYEELVNRVKSRPAHKR